MKQKQQPEPDWVSSDDARPYLHVTTREAVVAMINRGELPGSRKASSKATAAWIIPFSAIKAHPNYIQNKKRAQAQGDA